MKLTEKHRNLKIRRNRRCREKIKNDPEAHANYHAKERERYKKRKKVEN